MRIASVEFEGRRRLAINESKSDHWLLPMTNDHSTGIRSVKALIASGTNVSTMTDGAQSVYQDAIRFLTPILGPEKIICVGKNYEDHAKEMGGEKPELPVIFNKLPSSLIADQDAIVMPDISSKVDYEGELVVVIGSAGRNIAREDALDHVFGYTIGNDVTARDWQKGRPGGQWLLGKSFDTFAPVGPWIVTRDEVDDPQNLELKLLLNGEVMQNSNTSRMIFAVDYLIWHVSKFFTLQPGDLLFTGTPSGVGAGRNPEVYLNHGDEVAVSISGIGRLVNRVTK